MAPLQPTIAQFIHTHRPHNHKLQKKWSNSHEIVRIYTGLQTQGRTTHRCVLTADKYLGAETLGPHKPRSGGPGPGGGEELCGFEVLDEEELAEGIGGGEEEVSYATGEEEVQVPIFEEKGIPSL